MSENDLDAKQIEKKVHDLAEAMERVKTAQADRDDVVVEMKQLSRTRLEMLAQDIQPVFDALPEDVDLFEFALANGEPPRLWIDVTSFVRMGPDRRVFEFVKDTRLGRTIIAHTDDKTRMGEVITDYVAERVLERQRAIEGEWIAMKGYSFDAPDNSQPADTTPPVVKSGGWKWLGWMLLGAVVGTASLVAWAWNGNLQSFVERISG